MEQLCRHWGQLSDCIRLVRGTPCKNYHQEGIACLHDKPRAGRPIEIDGTQRAKITALACSQPPQGHGQWSLRLLADKAVELAFVEEISHEQVRKILKKPNLNHT